MVGTRFDSFGEGIEVDYDKVDFGNFVFSDLLTVAFVVTTVENTAENFGVESLDTTSKD